MPDCVITVLMPVYNAESYLSIAIESVLAQSFHDFEFVIVDDGSTDSSIAIAEKYAEGDSRIRILRKENSGISDTLNLGLLNARGDFIARLDADDVMYPIRLEIQFKFLSNNTALGFCGSFLEFIDANGSVVGWSKPSPVTRADYDKLISERRPITFNHPSIMFRKSAMLEAGGYDRSMEPTEDTDLFNKILALGYEALIVPQYLLKYRLHSKSIGAQKVKKQIENRDFVAHNFYARLFQTRTVTREEYANIVASRPFLHRLVYNTQNLYFAYKYMSLYDYANRRYIRMTIHFAFSVLLRPNRALRRVFILVGQGLSYPFRARGTGA
jgi:glycosyltransferase involved in cell wall biosynthesis